MGVVGGCLREACITWHPHVLIPILGSLRILLNWKLAFVVAVERLYPDGVLLVWVVYLRGGCGSLSEFGRRHSWVLNKLHLCHAASDTPLVLEDLAKYILLGLFLRFDVRRLLLHF